MKFCKVCNSRSKQISDLERFKKIAAGKVSPREVVYLIVTIPIKTLALESPQDAEELLETPANSCDYCEKIKTTLNQDAPVAIAKGMLLLRS
jgi:DNA mismatch repair protein MutS